MEIEYSEEMCTQVVMVLDVISQVVMVLDVISQLAPP
jgi:hypothetical protein